MSRPTPTRRRPAPRSPAEPRRASRTRTRGGGWLLPEPPLPRLAGAATSDGGRPRPTGRGLAHLETALDERSPMDRCRWLRLRAEAARWSGTEGGLDVRGDG